jgi:trimethylamine--corrinoid protein Co-methyltransferase
MPLPRLASDEQLQRLYDAALQALETVGFLVQDEVLAGQMVAAGAKVGPEGQVLIPRGLVEEMLAPRRAEPEAALDAPTRVTGEPRPGIGSQLAQFYLDPESQRRLPGGRELLAELVKFGHVWQPGSGVGPVLLCRDVPPLVEPMEAVVTIAEHTDRVGNAYVHSAEQVPYLAELGAILRDDPGSFLGMCLFLVTPLRMDLRAGRLLRALLERGAPVWIGTQPQAGASSPVTVAGTVVLGVAEILAGWVAAFAADPSVLPGAGICSGVLDMKTADVSFCAPEAMLQDLLCVELFRELCGGRCFVAGGASYTDAKWPGVQRGLEQAFEALTAWQYTGAWIGAGSGLLESGKTFSPVQFMLDHDCGRYLGQFARGVEFGEDDLALDSILDVGLGLKQSHMMSDHTLAHWRSLFTPTLLDRSCWRGDEEEAASEERLLAAAWEQFRAVRQQYEPAAVEASKLRAIREVVNRAWQELCGAERPSG